MELLFIVGQYARVNLIFFHNLINVIFLKKKLLLIVSIYTHHKKFYISNTCLLKTS